jgi:uncharacterized membrane protein
MKAACVVPSSNPGGSIMTESFYTFYRLIPFELHPAIVHLPIGLLIGALIFDLLYATIELKSLESAGTWCLVLGAVGGALAVLSGMGEKGTLGHVTEQGHELLERHELVGYVLLGLFALLAIWSLASRGVPQRARKLFLLLMLLGVGALGYQGYLGGEMVYFQAVGVRMEPMKQLVGQELVAPGAEPSPTPVPAVPESSAASPTPVPAVPESSAASPTPQPVPTTTPSP